jgi:hypothetical protein
MANILPPVGIADVLFFIAFIAIVVSAFIVRSIIEKVEEPTPEDADARDHILRTFDKKDWGF